MIRRDARQPLCFAVVGSDEHVIRELVQDLREHIVSDTRLSVHLAWHPLQRAEPMLPLADVLLVGFASQDPSLPSVDDTDAPVKAGAFDRVLLCRTVTKTDGRAGPALEGHTGTSPPARALGAEDRWRDRLIQLGLDWSVVGGADGDAVRQAMDALAPLLRGRASTGSGLFTRLTERNAQPAARLWRCADCDDPDCEHALRAVRSATDAYTRG
ncbi:MAG: hypothetical protein ACO305_08110 [Rubrivivax sp.]